MSSPNRRLLRYTRRNLQQLEANTAHQFAASYALSIYNCDAVYSFIPKNACSTMRYTIALANGAIAGPSDFNWIHANNPTFRASLRELVKAKYTFAILRDPYLRLGSCFLDKMVDQTAVAWQYHALTNYQIPPAMLTFRKFVADVKANIKGNEHWRPQLDFLVYRDYDDFFCLEAFSEAVATLRQKIGLVIRDARHLTKHGTDRFTPLDNAECFADTSAYEIAALKRAGRIPPIARLYDAELIAVVGRAYAADIAFYRDTVKRTLIF
jgi:hypothetical protein